MAVSWERAAKRREGRARWRSDTVSHHAGSSQSRESDERRAVGRRNLARVTDQPEGQRPARGWLFIATFAAGFAITGIEMALGRLLAPHFGSSLTVWAAIIASIIGALSVGYPLGGWLADRKPGPLLPLVALLVGGLIGAAMATHRHGY